MKNIRLVIPICALILSGCASASKQPGRTGVNGEVRCDSHISSVISTGATCTCCIDGDGEPVSVCYKEWPSELEKDCDKIVKALAEREER